MMTGIDPILDKVKTPLSILFTPALGQLILGKVKERISPFFLNLGLPALLPDLSGFIHPVFWTGAYFAASCGGVTLEQLKAYVQNQEAPGE